MTIKHSIYGVRVIDRYKDVPEAIRKFGAEPTSNLHSPDLGNIERPIPLNQLGDKMYPFTEHNKMGFLCFAYPQADDHTRELAYCVINSLSIRGNIFRYDMPDGTLFYVSFND